MRSHHKAAIYCGLLNGLCVGIYIVAASCAWYLIQFATDG